MDSSEEKIAPNHFLSPENVLSELGLEEKMKIADFGAGSGYIAFKAAEVVGPQGIIYALDIQKSVIEHLKKEIQHRRISNIKPIWTNLELVKHNPISDKSIDAVLIVNMLYQSNGQREILMEANRELKPGGILSIVDWKKEAAPFGPPPHDRIDLEKLKNTAYSIGFRKAKDFTPGPYHFGIIFRK